MPIKNGKEKEYKAWENAMVERRLNSSVRLAKWFLNLIDLGRLDIESIIFTFCHTSELFEMFGILESEKCRIILSIKAIIEYHDRGEEFRLAWNYYWLKNDALVIEVMKKPGERHVFNPYMKK